MAVITVHQEIAKTIKDNQQAVLKLWFESLNGRAKSLVAAMGADRMKQYMSDNLTALIKALPEGDDIEAKAYAAIRKLHEELCEELASKGVKPAEVPLYAFSKRDAIQAILLKAYPEKARLTDAVDMANRVVERLGLYIFDYYIKSREKQIQTNSQYARSLIEASLDPLVTISPGGKITDVNEATIKVTGASRESLIGTDFSNYFTEPEKAREGYQQVFAKGFVSDYPLTIRRKDGKMTDVLYNAAVYKDVGGNVLGVFAAARDVTAQKQASQYARSLIEASLDPLVTISPEGKITDVNEATIKVTGVSRKELVGADFSDYFTEPEKARAGYKQVFEKGFVTDYPLTIRHRDGRLTDVLYNASVYKDTGGNVLGVFAAARDVTESNRVLREFAETRNFLDNILQSSIKYSIIGKDLNHKILSWNEGARRNYGYLAEEIIGKDSNILHVPEDVASGAVDRLLAAAAEKGLAEGEFQRVRKDGSRFWASVVVTRRDDASGKPIGYLLMSSDISEKKQAEVQLRAASQYSRSLIEASLDPLVTIGPDGRIMDVNNTTEQATGVSREQLIGSDFSEYFTEPLKAREGYKKVFSQGAVKDYPLAIRHTSGKITEVLYNASLFKNEAGEVQGVFAAARDVTELKRAEEELKTAQAKTLLELAAPVVKVWEKILMIPLIGVMDSARAQLVMETLLTAIEENQAKVAILDVSGIPVVDSLVAKHLIRTVAAAKLMGTECIVTGIRSKISQTVIQLGIDLSEITTKTTLADGIKIAFDLTNQKVVGK